MSLELRGRSDAALSATYVAQLNNPRSALSGVTASCMRKFHTGMLNARQGGTERVMWLGDSTTYGFGATDNWNDNIVSQVQEMVAAYMGAPARPGIIWLGSTASTGGNKRAFITRGTGWTSRVGYGPGGVGAANAPAGTSGTFDVGPFTCDSWKVYWLDDQTAGATFDVWSDAGAHTTVTSTGSNTVKTTTISAGALGAHTFHAGAVTVNQATILGVEPLVATGGVYFSNVGAPSNPSSNFYLFGQNTNVFQTKNLVWTVPTPCLTVLCVGLNDPDNSVTSATTQTNLDGLIANSLVSGSALVVIPPKKVAFSDATWAPYRAAIIAAAAGRSVPVLDIGAMWQGGVDAQAGIYNSDGTHDNSRGQYERARAIYSVLAGL